MNQAIENGDVPIAFRIKSNVDILKRCYYIILIWMRGGTVYRRVVRAKRNQTLTNHKNGNIQGVAAADDEKIRKATEYKSMFRRFFS